MPRSPPRPDSTNPGSRPETSPSEAPVARTPDASVLNGSSSAAEPVASQPTQPIPNDPSERLPYTGSRTFGDDFYNDATAQINQYLNRQAQETVSSGSGDDTSTGPSQADPESSNTFDQLLDMVFGRRTRDVEQAAPSDAQPAFAIPGMLNGLSGVDTATVSAAGASEDNSGAIVITVNYMFMDAGNEPSPGRTGSLVVTLPNNATNREPRIISSLISLATRMAYSALVHNGPKPKPGVTLEKFESLKSLNVDDVPEDTCSICFEQYQEAPPVVLDDLITTKRRKLSPGLHSASASATPEPATAGPSASDAIIPPSDDAHSNSPAVEQESKPYLCDQDDHYDHSPLQMPCGHIFGRSCLAQWLKSSISCPLCRLAVSEPTQPSPRSVPVSYIRFGSLNDNSSNTQAPFNFSQREEPFENTESSDNQASNPEDRARPGLLRRATQVIFNPSSRRSRETPASPLDLSGDHESRSPRNPSFTPVINNIQNIFRRARRPRGSNSLGNSVLFPSGVSSRRTANGVETVNSDGEYWRDDTSSGGSWRTYPEREAGDGNDEHSRHEDMSPQ